MLQCSKKAVRRAVSHGFLASGAFPGLQKGGFGGQSRIFALKQVLVGVIPYCWRVVLADNPGAGTLDVSDMRDGRIVKSKEVRDVQALLKLSRTIDALNQRVGKATIWLVLVVTVISAINAVVRYAFNYSSNGLLEIQWYLFSAIFLLCAGYTLMRNEHVRIDVVSSHFSPRVHAWIDIIGTLFFLAPMAIAVLYLSWPIFINSFLNKEYSSNAGGLIVWPVRGLVPLGFALLILQGISELIKRIAFLKGLIGDPNAKVNAPSAEEELARAIKQQRGESA